MFSRLLGLAGEGGARVAVGTLEGFAGVSKSSILSIPVATVERVNADLV